jgi:hypothetical protein
VGLKPNLAPFAAKNIFPGPGLYASGNKKNTKAMISSSIGFFLMMHNCDSSKLCYEMIAIGFSYSANTVLYQ